MVAEQRELPSRRMTNALRVFILSPIVLLFGSAIRLLIISNYDPSTAAAIASLGGVAGTLLGTLVPLIPPFFPVVAFFLYILRMWRSLAIAAAGMMIVVPAHASLIESLSHGWDTIISLVRPLTEPEYKTDLSQFQPEFIFAATVAAIIIVDHFSPFRDDLVRELSLIDQRRQQGEQSRRPDPPQDREPSPPGKALLALSAATYMIIVIIGTAAPAIFTFAVVTHMYRVPYSYETIKEVVRKPWLPLEVIETKNARYVGYSIATRDGWHAILTDNERTVHYILGPDVKRREVCKKPSDPLSQPKPLIDFSEKTLTLWRSCPYQTIGY